MTAFKFFPIILLIGFIALYSTGNYAHEATASGVAKSGTITVKSVGYGKTKNNAIKDAEVTAIRQVLFEGVSGSEQPLPLVSDPESAKMGKGIYFNELLQERYKQYIESEEFVYQAGSKGSKKVTLALTVDVEGLKKDLAVNDVNAE
jgi:hypothetical protein